MDAIENVAVKVVGCKSYESDFGGYTYLNFVDAKNNHYFWRATGRIELPIHAELILSGKVLERQANGSITLTRCTVNGSGAGALASNSIEDQQSPHTASSVAPEEPNQPFEGYLGAVWGVADRGLSAVARMGLVILGLSCLLPFIGILIGAITVPALVVTAVVLLIRRSARAGTVQYGNRIVSKNLLWVLISLGIAIVCLAAQLGFLSFLSAIAGG